MTPRHLRSALAALAMLAMTVGLTPASGATVTCVKSQEVTDEEWGDPFVKRLRDQGLTRSDHPICGAAMLTGEIRPGDARKIDAIVRANLPFLGDLVLNSIGGSVDEGMQIGREARHYYLTTEAPSRNTHDGQSEWYMGGRITVAPGAICASACFFAWLGGAERTGDVLGIHRPFPPAAEMQKLSPAEAERLYHDLSGKVLAYLAEMDAAPHWLSDMMKIPSDDLYMIPAEQIIDELAGNPLNNGAVPSFAQWILSKCGGLSVEESHDLTRLSLQSVNGKLPKNMRGYLDYLDRREREVMTCGNQAVIEARWRLRSADPRTPP